MRPTSGELEPGQVFQIHTYPHLSRKEATVMFKTIRKFALAFAPVLAVLALVTPALAQTGSVFTDPPKSYTLTTGWYQGRATFYYDFGMNSPVDKSSGKVIPAPIYVLITGMDADGNPIMVPDQRNIIDVVPGDAGYSDLWQVNLVVVPSDYVANTFKSADDVKNSGYQTIVPGLLVNCPVVPLNSTLSEPSPASGSTTPTKGWYKGQEVDYFDFGPNPNSTAPIYAFITGFDSSGMPQFVDGQHNIIDVLPGLDGYSAFWDVTLVMVPDGYQANSITTRQQVLDSGYDMINPGLTVNCPVIRTDDAVTGNTGPVVVVGMPHTGAPAGDNLAIWTALAAGLAVVAGLGLRFRSSIVSKSRAN